MASKVLDPKTLSVGIIGFTGETGKALTTEILKNNIFKSTTLIGRRVVNFTEDFYNKGVQKVIDFDKMSENDEAFRGLDVLYCCLGTTRGKSGVDGFRKVDFDYVVESAKIAKKNGCKQFHLVSSTGANKNSLFLYPEVKGKAEEAVSNLGFEQTAIYRPKFLIAENGREEARIGEKIAITILKPFEYFAPKLMHTPIPILVKSMLARTVNFNEEKKVEILENNAIFEFAKQFDNKP